MVKLYINATCLGIETYLCSFRKLPIFAKFSAFDLHDDNDDGLLKVLEDTKST